jgi:hypothetical protein
LADAGKMIFHPAADTVTRTWTIPANASVAFPVGTVILCKIEHGAGAVRLVITSDTLIDPTGATGSRWLNAGITYWLIKETATKWGITRGVDTDYRSPIQIAIAHATTPFVSAYPWAGSGFGTKFTDPGTLPTGTGFGVAFNEI